MMSAWFLFSGLAGLAPSAYANQVFGAPVDPAALCQAATSFAEQTEALPAGILHAIGIIESGRRDAETGHLEPWPWTINANGVGHIYRTEQDAIAAAQAFQNAGVTSIDIGCLQVNLRQHPHAFVNLEHAFAPAENALWAGQFLSRLKTQLGGWNAAIAAYHSQTPALGLPYEQRVLAAWQGNGGAQLALGAAPALLGFAARQMQEPAQKPAMAKGPVAQKPAMPPPSSFAAGGFQFSALRGRAAILPMMAQAGGPAGAVGSAAAMPMRGLAAYRAAPIPIGSIQ